jgi:hypothetical protein
MVQVVQHLQSKAMSSVPDNMYMCNFYILFFALITFCVDFTFAGHLNLDHISRVQYPHEASGYLKFCSGFPLTWSKSKTLPTASLDLVTPLPF